MLNFGALESGNALGGLGDSGMSLTLMVSNPSLQGLSNIFIKAQESRRAPRSGTPSKLWRNINTQLSGGSSHQCLDLVWLRWNLRRKILVPAAGNQHVVLNTDANSFQGCGGFSG